jgi:hypothetical protein
MDYKALRGSQRSAAQKYARGGAVHSDAAEDKKMIDAAIKKYEAKDKKQDASMESKEEADEGMKRGGRLDKKSRSPKKDSVKVNVINVPKVDGSDPMASIKAPMPMRAPMNPPMPNRMMPMRKCGGRMK